MTYNFSRAAQRGNYSGSCHAGSISWTSWSFPAVTVFPYVVPGVATGTLTLNGVPITVTYAGQLINTSAATDWHPTATFDGGIGPAPSQ